MPHDSGYARFTLTSYAAPPCGRGNQTVSLLALHPSNGARPMTCTRVQAAIALVATGFLGKLLDHLASDLSAWLEGLTRQIVEWAFTS